MCGERADGLSDAGSVETQFAALAKDVGVAHDRIRPWTQWTPTVRLPWLDVPGVSEVWAKLECWQTTGSFKARGAFNVLSGFDPGQRSVTASAGNHGLAIATAARMLGQRARVFVPTTASELKVRRIVATGAEIVTAGRDLAEATRLARDHADRQDLPFVSPYADWTVAAGQGTCLVEALEDRGAFDAVVVPLGGGGLVAGVGAVLRERAPATRLVAVHPQVFAREFSADAAASLRSPTPPTHADGLAVQHLWPGPLDGILGRLLDDVRTVTETEILLAVFALLHEESLLLEGAGAVAAATMLAGTAERPAPHGRVLLLLTGGNVSSSTLARALVTGVSDERLRVRLGLRGYRPVLELGTPNTAAESSFGMSDGGDLDGSPDEERIGRWSEQALNADDLGARAGASRQLLDTLGLPTGGPASQLHDQLLWMAAEAERTLVPQLPHLPPDRSEDLVRVLLRLRELVTNGPEWASPAYDQSVRVNFYDPAFQSAGSVNYARYGTSALRDLELSLASMLALDVPGHEFLATSSGMAAYQVLEALLLRHVLRPGDVIVRAPYIYFETAEQVEALPFFRHLRADSYDVPDLVRLVEANDARVLFVDPLANIAGLPAIDLEELVRMVAGRPGWAERWLVVDGTMLSGALDLSRLVGRPGAPSLLYYESASKYAQFGLDLQMAGVCVVPASLGERARIVRRNSGAILYPDSVARFPRADREDFLRRLRVMSRNASHLAHAVGRDPRLRERLHVGWVDDWARRGWAHGGAVVTLRFAASGLNNRDGLDALIEACLSRARSVGVPLVKGLSFGFSTTRVSAASAMAAGSDPFLRFSVGSGSQREIGSLAGLVTEAVVDYLALFGSTEEYQ